MAESRGSVCAGPGLPGCSLSPRLFLLCWLLMVLSPSEDSLPFRISIHGPEPNLTGFPARQPECCRTHGSVCGILVTRAPLKMTSPWWPSSSFLVNLEGLLCASSTAEPLQAETWTDTHFCFASCVLGDEGKEPREGRLSTRGASVRPEANLCVEFSFRRAEMLVELRTLPGGSLIPAHKCLF